VCFPPSKLFRSNGETDDRYYYQENDRKHPNDIESLYEELKNVYDWSDGELKSGPRLRGDQRLRYESDDKVNANPLQLQSLNDGCLNRNDDMDKRYQPSDASQKSKTCVRRTAPLAWLYLDPTVRSLNAFSSRLNGKFAHPTFSIM